MKRKSRRITLIEVLIALGLTVGVLAAISWCYRAVTDLEARASQERSSAFEQAFVQARLAAILPLANGNVFYLSQKGLVFEFDNGVDLSADFSGNVIGRLYLDEKKFCLALMSLKNKEAPLHYEVILEDVEDLSFRFFEFEEGKLPATVTVSLKAKGKERSYSFILPYSEREVCL